MLATDAVSEAGDWSGSPRPAENTVPKTIVMMGCQRRFIPMDDEIQPIGTDGGPIYLLMRTENPGVVRSRDEIIP